MRFITSGVLRLAVACLFAAVVSGCITTVVGGTQPAEDDDRVKAHLDLARGYLNKKNWNRAKTPLRKALEIDPRSVETHVLFAYVYQNEGEKELAENSFKEALRISPRNSQALNNYGTFLFRERRYEEAAKVLRRAAADPTYAQRAQSYENLGLALARIDEMDDAVAALERSLELNFRQARATLELASIYYGRDDLEKASRYYENFKVLARQNRRSLCLGFKIASRQGDLNQASSYGLALKNLYGDVSKCTPD